LGNFLGSHPLDDEGWSRLWRQLTGCVDTLQDLARTYAAERGDSGDGEVFAWVTLLRDDIRSHVRDVESLVPWIHFAANLDASAETETQRLQLEAFRNQ